MPAIIENDNVMDHKDLNM